MAKTNHNEDKLKLPSLINREIIDIKKKIQLAEGERKALFEEIETQRKRDTQETQRLKNEIAKLQALQRHQSASKLGDCSNERRLKDALGVNFSRKSFGECIALLDQQNAERKKRLDLLRFRQRQKEAYLKQLAGRLTTIATDSSASALQGAGERRQSKKMARNQMLHNHLNIVMVQLREAEHVRKRYADIKWTLRSDAAQFESKLTALQEDITKQNVEIDHLQNVNESARKLKTEARAALQSEEREVLARANARDEETMQGRHLVEARARDLEMIERRFYQLSTKERGTTEKRSDEGSNEDVENESAANDDATPKLRHDQEEEEDEEEDRVDPKVEMMKMFEVLHEVTGVSANNANISDILTSFRTQTSTTQRLTKLRTNIESSKHRLLQHQQNVEHDLEKLKFVETKNAESSHDQLDTLNAAIEEQIARKSELTERLVKLEGVCDAIVERLRTIFYTYDFVCDCNDAPAILNSLLELLQQKRAEFGPQFIQPKRSIVEQLDDGMNNMIDDHTLPTSYNYLIRRTPLPQQGSPPITTQPQQPTTSQHAITAVSDDEDVPTRGYLKRQAQLVVDTKNKKKLFRIPFGKR